VLAYLACHRRHVVTRDELIELLWPIDPRAHPDEGLGAQPPTELSAAVTPGS
jgi:hypothetical protein